MKKLGQKGFTLVEGLLIVIALSLVVGVGYYVSNANKDDKKPVVTSKPVNQGKPKATPKDYLDINELNLKFDKTAIPTAYYKVSESERQRAYPKVPELKMVQLYDSSFDSTKNTKGEICGSLGSDIVVVQVISVADRDKNYAQYQNAEVGPNDDVPTVVSDRYAKRVGNYLYDYYKAQGVQGLISCVTADNIDQDKAVQDKFNDSYNKLKEMIATIQKS